MDQHSDGTFCVDFFKNEDGSCPVLEFLDSLENDKMRSRILRNIELLEQFGNALRAPFSKYLDDGIFELRTQYGSDISRVLYFFIIGRQIIMTNGFIKKTEKTPRHEIDTAKSRRSEFLSRQPISRANRKENAE